MASPNCRETHSCIPRVVAGHSELPSSLASGGQTAGLLYPENLLLAVGW